jgi:sugar/nucleoside kinase (ribokinase family)
MIHVIGAVCFDVVSERDSYISGTSNPSKISARLGGVAFNIFSHLSEPAHLISALGDDRFSDVISHMLEKEMGTVGRLTIIEATGTPSPFYIAIMESGELNVAASQMDVVETALTPTSIENALGNIILSDLLVIDANLSLPALNHVIEVFGNRHRIIYEPISVGKATRHRKALRDLFLITPNENEFVCLVGDDAPGQVSSVPASDEKVFAYLESRNIHYLLRTRGQDGATLYGQEQRADFPPTRRIRTGDTTGAGDMITALIVDRIHQLCG